MSHGWTFGEQGGADLYSHVCAACHQPDAKGAVGAGTYPPLAGDKKLVSAGFMLDVLLGGLNGMPPLGDMMSDAQVADVVNYRPHSFRQPLRRRRFGSRRRSREARAGALTLNGAQN